MDTVTELLNLYFICIDKDILSKKIVQDGMDSVVEFISLMFTGKFRDKRFKKHGIEWIIKIKRRWKIWRFIFQRLQSKEQKQEKMDMVKDMVKGWKLWPGFLLNLQRMEG